MKSLLALLLCFCMVWLSACSDESEQPDAVWATISLCPTDKIASNQSILALGTMSDCWVSIGGVTGTAEAVPARPNGATYMWSAERELPLGVQPIVVKWQLNGHPIEPDFPPLLGPTSIEVIAPDHIPPRLVSSEPIGGGTIAATTTLLHTTFSELIGRIEHASLASGGTVQEFGIYPATCNPELRWVVELQPATDYRLVLQGIYDFAWNRTEEVTVSFRTGN